MTPRSYGTGAGGSSVRTHPPAPSLQGGGVGLREHGRATSLNCFTPPSLQGGGLGGWVFWGLGGGFFLRLRRNLRPQFVGFRTGFLQLFFQIADAFFEFREPLFGCVAEQ